MENEGVPDDLPDVGSEPASQCCERCWAVVNDCHVDTLLTPAGGNWTSETYCSVYCGGKPTETNIACLEATNCQIVKNGLQNGTVVCGIAVATPAVADPPGTSCEQCKKTAAGVECK